MYIRAFSDLDTVSGGKIRADVQTTQQLFLCLGFLLVWDAMTDMIHEELLQHAREFMDEYADVFEALA
ncbi:hypothetical protein ALMA_0463 [Alloscardovia macacae]|uniref:Uncharacterized protein n=1 Tax=Alloscardovia macacae TaxID=1160091 RepID=A0A261F6F3_9BIFI|nr:hypothetical protein ALMA_0463 [Alloscardovia macacae]